MPGWIRTNFVKSQKTYSELLQSELCEIISPNPTVNPNAQFYSNHSFQTLMNATAALVKMEVHVLMESTATLVDVHQDSLEPTVKSVSFLN